MKANITLLVFLGLSSGMAAAQMQDPPDAVDAPAGAVRSEPRSTDMPAPDTSGSSLSDTSESAPVIPPAGPVERLEPKTVNGVTYMCGGVGKDEAAYMKQSAREHDMLLTFATQRGNYLADVNVDITTARGEPVLRTTCSGPLMQIDFPKSGIYRVHAAAAGYDRSRVAHIDVNRRAPTSLVMTWPQTVDVMGAEAPVSTGGGVAGQGAAQPGEQQSQPQRRMYDGKMHGRQPAQ